MRNLKKILALVLALVMSMSVLTVANAFEDAADVDETYAEAVEVLTQLGVFKGRTETEFAPKASITRAEVAAIIYRIAHADPEDKQVGIYADYNKFDDVKSTNWFAGYVNYCANAEYIKGYDAKTFGPNDAVTGYQALAMILRAVGYGKNGEFSGAGWEVRTASVAKSLGITDNIVDGTLGQPATREMIAEILFRAILVPTVTWNMAFGYQETDTTLGYDAFGLEEIVGVVTANEYANLEGSKTLAAGKTKLDGRTLNYTTTLADIGESRYAYISGKTVYALADTGLNVIDDNEGAKVAKLSALTDLDLTDAEHFDNFGGGKTYEASKWKITYEIDLSADKYDDYTAIPDGETKSWIELNNGSTGSLAADDTYTKVIGIGKEITELDLALIYDIFDAADLPADDGDYVLGEVYIGSQSHTDISDDPDVSYEDFEEKYVNTNTNAVEVKSCTNGNWLKVIDNNADGKAEYVLRTTYTAAFVADIDRNDEIELNTALLTMTGADEINNITDATPVVSADELAEGDVVYYALIDGKAQTYKSEMVAAQIDKVNRNANSATTVDGAEYFESGVNNQTAGLFQDGVRELAGKKSYDLYLDGYGYLMVHTETATSGEFALLTDGWFDSKKDGDEFAAKVWDREAKKITTVDVVDNASLFISDIGNGNDWDNLKEFAGINDDGHDMTTIVAALSEDGTLTPVEDVYNKRDIKIIATEDNAIPTNDKMHGIAYETGSKAKTAYNDELDRVELRALSTTVYYYVYPGAKNAVVTEYVGYKNIPSLTDEDAANIEDVYVVATGKDRVSNVGGEDYYYTANVVVVEFNSAYKTGAEKVFVVDTPVVGTGIDIDTVEIIGADGVARTVDIDLDESEIIKTPYGIAGGKAVMPGLYYLWETKTEGLYTITPMSHEDIRANNYSVGMVETTLGSIDADWAGIREFTYDDSTDLYDVRTGVENEWRLTEDSKVYTLGYSENRRGDMDATLKDDVNAKKVLHEDGDRNTVDGTFAHNTVLVAYNNSDEIIYAISFAMYDGENTTGTQMLPNFAQQVWDGAKPAGAPVEEFGVKFYGVEDDNEDGTDLDADVEDITVTYTTAKNHGDKNAIVVTGSNVDRWAVVDGSGNKTVELDKDNTKAYTLTINMKDGTVVTYDLQQNAKADDEALFHGADDMGAADTEVTAPVTVVKPDNRLSLLSDYADLFENPNGSRIDWKFYSIRGTEVAMDGHTLSDAAWAGATVNNEKSYVIVIDDTNKDDVVTGNLEAMIEALYKDWTLAEIDTAATTIGTSMASDFNRRVIAYRQAGWTAVELFTEWGGNPSFLPVVVAALQTADEDTDAEILNAYLQYLANVEGTLADATTSETVTKSGSKWNVKVTSSATELAGLDTVYSYLTGATAKWTWNGAPTEYTFDSTITDLNDLVAAIAGALDSSSMLVCDVTIYKGTDTYAILSFTL